MAREGTTIDASRRVRACLLLCPEYTGTFWDPLPRLADGVTALADLLGEQGVDVVRLPVDSATEALTALRAPARKATA